MGKSLKINFLLNFVNTITVVLFPMITFPYASRILLADGIGQVNFLKSIIDYVGMFVCLGIPMYAVREIARVRDDHGRRNQSTAEILYLNLLLTFFGYLVIIILAVFLDKISTEIPLFIILSLSILLMTLGCEWFYKGIEDFKYITIRGLFIKVISLFLLFFLVKSKQDIMWYAVYNVFGVTGGNIFNFIRLRKYVKLEDIKLANLDIWKHLKPSLNSFVLNLYFAIYITLNTIMLGFLSTNESVGYFTAATKLTQISLAVVNSLGIVLLPRLSNLLSKNQNAEFHDVSQKALRFIIALSLPMTAGLMLVAPYIIPIFCGDNYSPAITNLVLVAPVVLIIGLSSFIGIQILYPQGKEKIVIICTLSGTCVNILFNFILIPRLSYNGAAIGAVIGQLVLFISLSWLGRKNIKLKWDYSFVLYLFATLIMSSIIYLLQFLEVSMVYKLIFSIVFGGIVYGTILAIVRDDIYLQIRKFIIRR